MYARQVAYEDGDLTSETNELFKHNSFNVAYAAMSKRMEKYQVDSKNESDTSKSAILYSMANSIDEAIRALIDWNNK